MGSEMTDELLGIGHELGFGEEFFLNLGLPGNVLIDGKGNVDVLEENGGSIPFSPAHHLGLDLPREGLAIGVKDLLC
jgi:hypothetical protein